MAWILLLRLGAWAAFLGTLLGPVSRVSAQPAQGLPEQLEACQSLLRVKQELVCRCDQAEGLAANLLRRLTKAEEEIERLRSSQVKEMPKTPPTEERR